ncbi:MAG: hypothetical protein IPQ07_22820 [Myxococcales bacterium]|nr:hypothetical protein [Myxococcales bacterium]
MRTRTHDRLRRNSHVPHALRTSASLGPRSPAPQMQPSLAVTVIDAHSKVHSENLLTDQEVVMTNAMEHGSSNTTDATIGLSLRMRVEARKAEIEAAIASTTLDARTRRDLESALGAVDGLLTGDLDRIPKVVAIELNTWLEASKHLDEHHEAASGGGSALPSTESFSTSG